ncbi:MAG TPA: DedA family protein [Castellaniella sp.]|uniref:DedA family protein n=1 Tax=Castellaniella sp. TaxID=1955812 RepID=UPI002EF2DE2D
MDIATLIHTYGYWAVAVGTFLEGETVLLAAAAAAARNYLWLPGVVAVAALGGFVGDQFFFWVGHRYGARLVRRYPALERRTARVQALLKRHNAPIILVVRFLYGLRVAGPVAIGISGVSWGRFAAFNAVGAALWASLVGGLGYGLGEGLDRLIPLLGDFDADELRGIAAIVAGLVVVWLTLEGVRALRARSVCQQPDIHHEDRPR